MVYYRFCQRIARVGPKELTMASWTTARTIGNVDSECHLVRNFLKDDTRVHIFKHRSLSYIVSDRHRNDGVLRADVVLRS